MGLTDVLGRLGRIVAYHPELTRLTESVTAGILLSQLIYWNQYTEDEEGWIYKTQEDWSEEIGLSRREQENARKRLRKLGFLQEKYQGIPRKLYYRILPEVIDAAFESKFPNKIAIMHQSASMQWRKAPDRHGGKRHAGEAESAIMKTPRKRRTRVASEAPDPPPQITHQITTQEIPPNPPLGGSGARARKDDARDDRPPTPAEQDAILADVRPLIRQFTKDAEDLAPDPRHERIREVKRQAQIALGNRKITEEQYRSLVKKAEAELKGSGDGAAH